MIRPSLILLITFTFSCAFAQQIVSSSTNQKVVKREAAIKAIPAKEYHQNSVPKDVVSNNPRNPKLEENRIRIATLPAIPLSTKPNIAFNQKKIATHNTEDSKSITSLENSKSKKKGSKKVKITKQRVLIKEQIKTVAPVQKTISKEPLPSSTVDEKKKFNGHMKYTKTPKK